MAHKKLIAMFALASLPTLTYAHVENFYVTASSSLSIGVYHAINEIDHLLIAVIAGLFIAFNRRQQVPKLLGLLAPFPLALVVGHSAHHGFILNTSEVIIAILTLVLSLGALRPFRASAINFRQRGTQVTLLVMLVAAMTGALHANHIYSSEQIGTYSLGMWFGLHSVLVLTLIATVFVRQGFRILTRTS